ncbi:Uncharacterized protein SCF082_LOCUS23312, partial [Durusdinium trenchii]
FVASGASSEEELARWRVLREVGQFGLALQWINREWLRPPEAVLSGSEWAVLSALMAGEQGSSSEDVELGDGWRFLMLNCRKRGLVGCSSREEVYFLDEAQLSQVAQVHKAMLGDLEKTNFAVTMSQPIKLALETLAKSHSTFRKVCNELAARPGFAATGWTCLGEDPVDGSFDFAPVHKVRSIRKGGVLEVTLHVTRQGAASVHRLGTSVAGWERTIATVADLEKMLHELGRQVLCDGIGVNYPVYATKLRDKTEEFKADQLETLQSHSCKQSPVIGGTFNKDGSCSLLVRVGFVGGKTQLLLRSAACLMFAEEGKTMCKTCTHLKKKVAHREKVLTNPVVKNNTPLNSMSRQELKIRAKQESAEKRTLQAKVKYLTDRLVQISK